ncbi:MAG: hypothetical protein EAZ97_09425 [Bacteroidetes bacterium]|nr:MAG: hypothetical protein EAZ97_09425 [Bacteroidota bacterium]
MTKHFAFYVGYILGKNTIHLHLKLFKVTLMKIAIFLLCFFAFSNAIFAQNKKIIDSLMTVYHTAKHDTTKILTTLEICSQYRYNLADTALLLAQKALQQSEELNYEQGKALAYARMGLAYRDKNKYIESLAALKQAIQLSEKLRDKKNMAYCFHNIGVVHERQGNYFLALEFYQKNLDIVKQLNDKKSIAITLHTIGVVYEHQGNYPLALAYYQKSLKIWEELKDRLGTRIPLGTIGVIYERQGNYPLALEHYQKSLKIAEEFDNKQGVAIGLRSIGMFYENQGNDLLALEYYQKSLKINEELKNKRYISISLANMATMYLKQSNYSLALEYFEKSLKIAEEIKDKRQICFVLNGLAKLFQKQKQYDKSVDYAQKGLLIAQEINALFEVKELNYTLYESYKSKGEYAKALEYYEFYKTNNDSLFNADKSKAIANLEAKSEIDRKEKEIEILNKNKELDQKTKEALQKDLKVQQIEAERQKNAKLILEKQAEADRLFGLARQEKDKRKQDSLQNIAQKTQLEADNLKAKDKQFKAEQAQKDIAQEKQRNQFYWIIFSAFAGLVFTVVILFLISRSRKKIQNAYGALAVSNAQVQQAKEEIEVQSDELQQSHQALNLAYIEIHKRNEDVTASINYAKRIQNAILPFDERFGESLGKDNFFILFKPKDIVSGDFYWFEEIQKSDLQGLTQTIKFVAVADCTGHGVPGAFMSMIGNQLLHEIIIKNHIYSPDQILNNLHKEVHRVLRQKETNTNDGMDMVIIAISPTKIEYAGAMNPLYYVQNNELKEIKATKRAIGGKQSEEERFFEKHQIRVEGQKEREERMKSSNPCSRTSQLCAHTTIYLCTDGYQDQFGGEKDKKFMVKKLRELLFSVSEKTMTEQGQILGETFDSWKGNYAQVDDVTILGIRL